MSISSGTFFISHFSRVSRVAASILRGLGLDELVQPTVDDYVKTVVRMANEPALLAAVRTKMAGILTPGNILSRQRDYGRQFSGVLCRAREQCPAPQGTDGLSLRLSGEAA